MPPKIPAIFFTSEISQTVLTRWLSGTGSSRWRRERHISFCPPITTSMLHCTCPRTGAGTPTGTVVLSSIALRKSSALLPGNSVQLYPDV